MKHNKQYNPEINPDEDQTRFFYWHSSWQEVLNHKDHQWTVSLNEFSDLSPEEKNKYYLNYYFYSLHYTRTNRSLDPVAETQGPASDHQEKDKRKTKKARSLKRKKEKETQKIPTEKLSTREERQKGMKKIYYANKLENYYFAH